MTVRLTPRQYRTLVKMAWLASRVAHGAEISDSETVTGILDLTDFLCNLAPEFGAEDMFETVEIPTELLAESEFSVGTSPPVTVRIESSVEEELLSIIEWFEEYSFWEILEDRLAMRDISEERTEAQWNWLPDAEKDRLYDKYVDFYFEEFAETGVSSLRLIQPEPGTSPIPLGWGDGNPQQQTETPDSENGPEKRPRSGKIIEFPGVSRPGGAPDGKPPKKPRT